MKNKDKKRHLRFYGFLQFCKTVETVTFYAFYGFSLENRKSVNAAEPSALVVV